MRKFVIELSVNQGRICCPNDVNRHILSKEEAEERLAGTPNNDQHYVVYELFPVSIRKEIL